MRATALTLALLVIGGCAAQPQSPGRTIVIPAGMDRAYDDYHYAPAVRVGDLVIVSGIPAARGDSYEAKVRWMFERLKSTLAAAGASMADVVEITTFHRDVHDTPGFQAEFDRFLAVHHEYFGAGYPAWSAVGTTALLSDGAPVEMRAVAVVGAGRHTRIARGSAPPPAAQ